MTFDPLNIPPTRDRKQREFGRKVSEVGGLRVYGLTAWDIAGGSYKDVDVGPCDYVRVQCSYPVVIELDGTPINVPLVPPNQSGTGTPSFAPQLVDIDASDGIQISPAFDVEIRRRVSRLSIRIPNEPSSYHGLAIADAAPGFICRVWLGSGGVERATWGLPIHHVLICSISGEPEDAEILTNPSSVAIWGDDADAPNLVGDKAVIPHWTEILSVASYPEWFGVPGYLQEVALYLDHGSQAYQRHLLHYTRFNAIAGTVPRELSEVVFHTPIGFSPYAQRTPGALGTTNGIRAFAAATADMDGLTAYLNCRSWL